MSRGVPGLVETREAHGETTLVVDPARIVEACTHLRDAAGFTMLVDISPTDYLGWGEIGVAGYIGTPDGRDIFGPGSQGLARVPRRRSRSGSRSRTTCSRWTTSPRASASRHGSTQGEEIDSVIAVWPAADWYEREAWDMFGIRFTESPEPRADPHAGRLGRPSAAQGLPARRRAGALLGGRVTRLRRPPGSTTAPASRSPCPTILEIDPAEHDLEDILQVNFGPNHPSTHGVLRLIVDLDGERIAGIRAVIGYLHTGFEKTMEQKTYWKGITYPERIDYLSFQANELVFVLAIEKLLELETPPKAQWMRMCLTELNRIHSHLVWLGTSALEIGAISMFWYAFRERDMILDLFEMVTGVRMHTRYFQVGGLAEDIPDGFYEQARAAAKRMPKAVDDYEALLDRNKIWLERTKGIGLLSADDAIALGQTGPMLRASGVDWDLRREMPYLRYDEVDFEVPVYPNGDVYDRYKVHMDEMRQSARIVTQCVDRLEELRGRALDRGRQEGRAAAARGAPHLDGVPHPPLQDRHRGLPRARGRGLRGDRVGARRVRLLPRLRRRPQAVAGEVPRAQLRGAAGHRHVHARCGDRRHGRRRRLARPA